MLIGDFVENAPKYQKDIDTLREKMETADQQEVIDSIQETLRDIRPEKYENSVALVCIFIWLSL